MHCLKLSPNLRRQPQRAAPAAAPAKPSGTPAKPALAVPVDAGIRQLDAIFLVALKSMATEDNHDRIMEEVKVIQEAWEQAKVS